MALWPTRRGRDHLKPERWQQISRIFNRAISLDAAARAAYVEQKCGTDSDLRAEVERLIESHDQAEEGDFIGGLAVEDVAEEFTEGEETLALHKGQQFGDYLILDHLGTGGMGEVYLARDSRLDRTVALKILASDVAADKRRMQRFRQEAKVASSLNQPNILTIYEFGEVGDLTFLAAEFVDGDTLRNYLRTKELKIGEILDIAIQVLAALDATHEARIVHRDIKPENVMIRRRDRLVKVLDFGLARVTERKAGTLTPQESEAATEFKTGPHAVMGTINYMSPEQAQAHAVDERTDIWSTGVMIYEMVCGMMPFKGLTPSHTIVQILEKDPVPLTNFPARKVPSELQRIVAKSLAKGPDERYQTAKDMLVDLRSLKKRLDVESEIDRTSLSGTPRMTAATDAVDREPQKKRVLGIALVGMMLATAGIFWFSFWRASRARPNPSVTTVPSEERMLTYWITIQRFRNGKPYEKPFTQPGEVIFEADYKIQVNVRSPQPGYLYIFNEGPPEQSKPTEFVVLFPTPTANKGSPLLAADQVVQIPEKSWFEFDKQQGTEKLWLVFSADAVPELEAIGAANPQTAGLITESSRNRVVQNFLSTHSANKPLSEEGDATTLKSPGKLLVHVLKLAHY